MRTLALLCSLLLLLGCDDLVVEGTVDAGPDWGNPDSETPAELVVIAKAVSLAPWVSVFPPGAFKLTFVHQEGTPGGTYKAVFNDPKDAGPRKPDDIANAFEAIFGEGEYRILGRNAEGNPLGVLFNDATTFGMTVVVDLEGQKDTELSIKGVIADVISFHPVSGP